MQVYGASELAANIRDRRNDFRHGRIRAASLTALFLSHPSPLVSNS